MSASLGEAEWVDQTEAEVVKSLTCLADRQVGSPEQQVDEGMSH